MQFVALCGALFLYSVASRRTSCTLELSYALVLYPLVRRCQRSVWCLGLCAVCSGLTFWLELVTEDQCSPCLLQAILSKLLSYCVCYGNLRHTVCSVRSLSRLSRTQWEIHGHGEGLMLLYKALLSHNCTTGQVSRPMWFMSQDPPLYNRFQNLVRKCENFC